MESSAGRLPEPRQSPHLWHDLGTRIATARAANAWSVDHIARVLEVGVVTVRAWEVGQQRPQPRVLSRLATLLNIPYGELADLAGYQVSDVR
jgi:ribosome-binding protein aMBF1 (putative translation factor)